MKRKKLLKRLGQFFDLDQRNQREQLQKLKKLLKKLREKEQKLRDQFERESDEIRRKRLGSELAIVHAQRIKGIEQMKRLKPSLEE